MISVILNVQEDDSAKVARTLQNLVPYAVEGFVVDVTVLHDGLEKNTRLMLDEAGCNILPHEEGLSAVCVKARGDWLLFMEPGAALETGWAEIVHAHAMADGGAAQFKLSVTTARPWWQRLLNPRTFKSPLARGLLISKRQAKANMQGKQTPAELMRGLATKRLAAGIYAA